MLALGALAAPLAAAFENPVHAGVRASFSNEDVIGKVQTESFHEYDLWATVRVRPHPVFRREGRDVIVDVPVTIVEAVRGAKIEVPTLEGRATVTVPPGTDSGQKLRLRGKGIPDPKGGAAGDLYVVIQVRVPKQLDADAAAALDALAKAGPENPRKELFR